MDLPSWVTELFDKLRDEHDVTISVRERLVTGRSGAFVALVDTEGESEGVLIVKAAPISRWGQDEASRHRQVVASKAFSGQTPQLVASTRTASHYLMLMNVTGQSRLQWRPAVTAPGLFGATYTSLCKLLWTPLLFEIGSSQTIGALLRANVGYRLTPAEGGRILDNLPLTGSDHLLDAPQFVFVDSVLPNPIHLALYPDEYVTPELKPVLGPTHGDCHAHNVFIKAGLSGAVQAAALIDFASYDPKGLVFFDHAYFELAALLQQCEALGTVRWNRLASSLAREDGAVANLLQHERGWYQDILRGRDAMWRHAKATYPNRMDDLRRQWWVAAISAGLAFLNKQRREAIGSIGLVGSQYQQALVWAGHHMSRMVEEHGIVLSRTVSAIPNLVASDRGVSQGLSEHDWSTVGGFDATGFNILVLSPSFRHTNHDLLVKILSAPWRLVIDFGTTAAEKLLRLPEHANFRQAWPTAPAVDVRLLNRGALWLFADGRDDISDSPPQKSGAAWRRQSSPMLSILLSAIARQLSPTSVRVLTLGQDFDPIRIRFALELCDLAFGDTLCPIVSTSSEATTIVAELPTVGTTEAAVMRRFGDFRDPMLPVDSDAVLLPHRSEDGTVSLKPLDRRLVARLGRDLTLVHRGLARTFPMGREFAVGFRRGQLIEWSELAQGIDVRRMITARLENDLRVALEASTNATVNLIHEASAGGTTVSRRLAWDLSTDAPTALLNQISADTASYLRDMFQACKLPLLVLMEPDGVTETAREALLQQLREENTRAVFLWVSRTYERQFRNAILSGRLEGPELPAFVQAYSEDVTDGARLLELNRLAQDPMLAEQRSPFFFGLVAYGERYLGLDRLVADVLSDVGDSGQALLSDLALISRYSSVGMPRAEFLELSRTLNARQLERLDSPYAIWNDDHIKIPHVLIAESTLRALSRTQNWSADLYRIGTSLLDHLELVTNKHAGRVLEMIETVFLNRDIERVFESDEDSIALAASSRAQFSPYILALEREHARQVLKTLTEMWPAEPHHAVHYVRHLLYESPREIDTALEVALRAERATGDAADGSVVHIVGMCYRARMDRTLRDAEQSGQSFDAVADPAKREMELALGKFQEAIGLARPRSEYGHVAAIQTVTRLLTGAMTLMHQPSLSAFIGNSKYRWCVGALTQAEEHIQILRRMPGHLSSRAEKTLANWDRVYGRVDKLIERLRKLVDRFDDPSLRRAYGNAVLAKASRDWRRVPETELRTIVSMMERNLRSRNARESDVKTWFNAYRHLTDWDIEIAVSHIVDWHQVQPRSSEPAFYLHVLYFVMWLNSPSRNEDYALESRKWLEVCRQNRQLGFRSWSYEWLTGSQFNYTTTDRSELGFEPIDAIRGRTTVEEMRRLSELPRLEGTVVDYVGPQQASLDLGQGMKVRFTPRQDITKDEEGLRATLIVSFGYDAVTGWDPVLLPVELRNA